MSVQPFPFGSLEALSRAEVASVARLRRFARTHVRLEGLGAALAEILEEPVDILIRRARRAEGARGADDSVGIMIALAEDARSTSRRALVEIEGALAARMAARAMKQRGPRISDPSKTPPPALAGAVAAVLSTSLRRAHAGVALRVVAAGPGHALARDLVTSTPEATTLWLTVIAGADAFDARVTVPDGAITSAGPTASLRDALLGLGDAPLALPLVVAQCLSSRDDLRALSTGDAFVPTGLTLSDAGSGQLEGPVSLVAPTAERGLGADLAPGGRLVVRGQTDSFSWQAEAPMTEANTVEVLEDAPVVVRVELGTVELKARQWAELAPGDVVSLGRKLGDPAILRVGGVEIARGELVSVEGEYAVRILSRGEPR